MARCHRNRKELALTNTNDNVPLVQTGYLDPKHLPEGHPDRTNLCQYCDRLDPAADESGMCIACIADDPAEHRHWEIGHYYEGDL